MAQEKSPSGLNKRMDDFEIQVEKAPAKKAQKPPKR